MGILDPIKGVVKAVTPKPVENLLFGRDEMPSTPSNPEDARRLIDNVIGREPGDTRTVRMIRDAGRLSSTIPAFAREEFKQSLYEDDAYGRLVTGNLRVPTDEYITADQLIGEWLAADPRRQQLYIRETDPMNPLYIPYVIEANAKHHDGLLAKAKNVAGDLLKRPIGGALDLLGKPAQAVETWYGTHFVWNDIPDASLRHAMAKYTYESRLNIKDWDMTWEGRAREKAHQINASGMTGDAAVADFEEWVKTDGRLKQAAFFGDLFGQIMFDPLWFVPTGAIGAGVKKAGVAVTGTEDIGKLARLTTAAGRAYAGEHTIKDLMKLSEVNYATMKLAGPTARGPFLYLSERAPDRLADAAVQRSVDLISGPLSRAGTASEKLQILARFDNVMKTGKIDEASALLFGDRALEDPIMARLHFYAKGREKPLTEGVLEGLTKNTEYLTETSPDELSYLLTNHMMGTVRSAVRDGQLKQFPKWFTKGWLPVVTAQKMALGIFSLGRPGFVALNMANNFFTFMWHAMGNPMDGAKMFARSFKAEMSTVSKTGGHLDDYHRGLAKAANLDPVAIERTVVGNVSHQDILGQKLGYPFRLDDEAVDVGDAIKKAQKAIAQPIKDMNPLRFRDLVAWPITVASRVDRMARRATFYYNLKQQLHMAGAPERLLTRGVEGSKGGLMPDLKKDLIRAGVPHAEAEHAEGFMYDHMLDWLKNKGGSLGDEKAIRKAYLEGVNKMLSGTQAGRLSAFDFGMQFMARRGLAPEASVVALQDIDEVMTRVSGEVFSHADDMPIEQLRARLDRIANDYWTTDRLMAELDHTDPVLRPGTDYSQTLAATEEGIRADIKDNLLHLDRYLEAKAPLWSGNAESKRRIMRAMGEYSTGRMTRLSHIRSQKIDALAEAKDFPEAEIWREYFEYTDNANETLYKVVKDEIAKVDTTATKVIDDWYKDLTRTRDRHQEIIAEALRGGKAEDWQRAGKEVGDLYRRSANRRAGRIFRWAPNEPQRNLGVTRPTAALANLVDEYIDFVKMNIGKTMGREAPANWTDSLRSIAHGKAVEAASRGPEVARHIAANARMATDFVMLNYNNQYGWDNMFQMVFPYEFFPTRTAMNWMIRAWQQPGAAAMLAKMLLKPSEYQETYDMPERLKYKIPVFLPGLDNFLQHLPGIGPKIQGGEFHNYFWVDPMSMLFPMANFRDDFKDEQRRSTPMGLVADWMEQNTPLSMSPVAKIIGSFVPGPAGLERDAWINSLFSGGPFGVPLNAYARAAQGWLQTGDSDLPDEERELYTDTGHFSDNWLAKALNLAPDKYESYRTDRALASLVATGDVSADDAWEALRTQSGPAWDKAKKASGAETFLSEFTGWLGFRVTGSLEGEQVRIGLRALFNKAAENGTLEEFYDKYPEYEIGQIASKGISDPEGRKQLLDNHFYYRDVEKLVEQPYQKALDDVQQKLDAISAKGNILETDKEYERLLKDQLSEIKDEQDKIREMLDVAYPNRDKELSLNMPPKERALQNAARGYYEIEWDAASETYEDYLAKRERYLDQFPAREATDREQDWQGLFVAYQAGAAKYNLAINAAYDKADFAKAERLRKEKENLLTQIHDISTNRVTRYDMEMYLSSAQRSLTQGEVEWEQANAMFDLWMAYVSDESPLTDRQKGAVSAYFRQDPLLRKHYNVQTINIRALSGDQLLSLGRRRDIWNQYYAIQTNAAKIDYMMSIRDELNEINAMLGLPPIELLDYRPAPPDVLFRTPEDAGEDFRSGGNVADFLREEGQLDPMDPVLRAMAREEGGLSTEDIARYVDPVVQRGY